MSDIDNKFFLFNEGDQFDFETISSEKTRALAKSIYKVIEKKSELNNEIKLSLTKDEVERFRSICSFVIGSDGYNEKIRDQIKFDDLIWKLRDDKKNPKAEEKMRKIFKFFRFGKKKRYNPSLLITSYYLNLAKLNEKKCTLEDIINMYYGDPLYLGPDENKSIRREDIPKHKIAEAEELINEFYGKTVNRHSVRLRGESKKKKRNINQVAYALVAIEYGLTEDALRKHFPLPKSSSKKR